MCLVYTNAMRVARGHQTSELGSSSPALDSCTDAVEEQQLKHASEAACYKQLLYSS